MQNRRDQKQSAGQKVVSFLNRLSRPIRIATIVVIAITLGAKLLISNSLPACDSKEARYALSDIFNDKKVSVKKYNEIKTLTTSDIEITCLAMITLESGGNTELKYKIFFNENNEKQLLITSAVDLPN